MALQGSWPSRTVAVNDRFDCIRIKHKTCLPMCNNYSNGLATPSESERDVFSLFAQMGTEPNQKGLIA